MAYFLTGTPQLTILKLALESASSLNDTFDRERTYGYVLEDAAEYVDIQSILPFITQCFADHIGVAEFPYYKESLYPHPQALHIIAERFDDKIRLLEIMWPVMDKILRLGYGPFSTFLCTVSPYLNAEWLAKLLIFSSQKADQVTTYPCLRKRWLELSKLSRPEGYEVWCEVIQALHTRPRNEFLEHLSWFTNVIFYLGKEQAIIDTGESVLQIGRWWR